jgi:hypothetical protein
MPTTDQVSITVALAFGTISTRATGRPAGVNWGPLASITLHEQKSQLACWMPLAKFQRPRTR